MNNQWKMVPVEPTDDMIVSFAEAWYSKRQCIDDPDMLDAYRDMLAAAPVPPAGDVEVQRYSTSRLKWSGGEIVCSVAAPIDVVLASDYEAQVTRLTAERDGLKLAFETACSEGDALLVRAKDAECERDVLQSELTKARELLRRMTTDYACCLEAGHERITALGGDCDSVEKMLDDNRDYAEARAFLATPIAHNADESCGQDTEAAKGDSDE